MRQTEALWNSGARTRRVLAGAALLCVLAAGCGQQQDPPVDTAPQLPGGPTSSAPGDGPAATTDVPTDGGAGTTTGTATPTGTATSTGSATSTGTATIPGTAAPTVTATATATQTEPVEATQPAEGFLPATEVATSEPTGAVALVVTGVRTGAHEDYDRVVLDLVGSGTVGWRIRYEDDPTLDGSGAPVDLAGAHTLVVTVIGTRMPEPGEDFYQQGHLLVPGSGLSVVTEVLRAAPFEGQLNAYIGSRAEVPYRVLRLEDPARLVIDLALP